MSGQDHISYALIGSSADIVQCSLLEILIVIEGFAFLYGADVAFVWPDDRRDDPKFWIDDVAGGILILIVGK